MNVRMVISGIVILAIVSSIVGYVLRRDRTAPPQSPTTVACTMEAKQCPDGSYVSRTGPACEFAACPSVTSTPVESTSTAAIGGQAVEGTTTITVLSLVEDSRCPVDVQCIQAGTVRVTVAIDAYNRDFVLTLGKPENVGNTTITLVNVVPNERLSKRTIPTSAYRFTFQVN